MKAFFLLYWIKLLISVIIAGGVYFVYEKVVNVGYQRAKTEDAIVIKGYENQIAEKINTIITLSGVLVSEGRTTSAELTASINSIVKATKGKTLTIIKNGECLPSQTFSDTFVNVNKRVNQTIKETSK